MGDSAFLTYSHTLAKPTLLREQSSNLWLGHPTVCFGKYLFGRPKLNRLRYSDLIAVKDRAFFGREKDRWNFWNNNIGFDSK